MATDNDIERNEIQRIKSERMEKIRRSDRYYEYPKGLDLHPDSRLHQDVVKKIMDRVRSSRRMFDKVKREWQEMDWSLTAYVPPDEVDAEVMRDDWRKPVNVTIPMTFAAREVFLTYTSNAFLSKPVVHRYKGTGNKKAMIRAALLERLVAKQNKWFKEDLNLLTQWSDAFTYGIGAVSPQWSKHKARRPFDVEITEVLEEALKELDLGAESGDILRYMQEVTVFEGNRLRPIDPYRIILDPFTPINDLQESEFVGWMETTNAMQILRKEADPEERRFNGRYVAELAESGLGRSVFYYEDESGRGTRQLTDGRDTFTPDGEMSPVDDIHICIDLIPQDWGLGDEDYPVIYSFTLSADEIITGLDELKLDHGMYPVAVASPNSSGHDTLPVSHLATTYGLQKFFDWMMKSRADNVRKSINDMILADPQFIDFDDLLNPGPGKIIRLKQSAFGNANMDAYIKQFPVADVTGGHVREAGYMIELYQKVLGITDPTMGDFSGLPERPTARGIDAASKGALSRMQLIARKIATQSMRDLAWQEAYNTLQFMDQITSVSILGDKEAMLREEFGLPPDETEILIGPGDLDASFEIEPLTGALPDAANQEAMTQILQTLLNNPDVLQVVTSSTDVVGFFKHWARVVGADDVNEFIRRGGGNVNTQVMPDEQVMQQAQAGNLVPIPQVA
jgi:hypothetical protein